MLFTIGYSRLPVADLDRIAAGLDATILDVRGIPKSRQSGYGRLQLAARFGSRLVWRGDELGNKGAFTTTPAGLASLRAYASDDGPHGLLMCCCEAPGECHRHFLIASKLRFPVWHIYRNEVVEAQELTRMMRAKKTDPSAIYAFTSLDQFIALPETPTP